MNSRLTTFACAAIVGALLLFAAGCNTPSAASDDSPANALDRAAEADISQRAALGVRTERHLQVAMLTAQQALDGSFDYQADHFVIVVCGPAVQTLVEPSDQLADVIDELPRDQVEIKACELTIDTLGIDAASLPAAVQLVPNGLIELMRLQAAGYQSVEL